MFIRASRIGVAGLAVAAFMTSGLDAQAGLLSSNSGGAMPGYTGSIAFSGDSFTDYGFVNPVTTLPYTVSANVDYAVFAPGTFDAAFPGQDPSNGTEYVYAYQIENLDTDIIKFTVGLDGDEPLGTIGYVTAVGLVDPTASSFIGAGPTSAAWDYTAPGALTSVNSSAVLIFTSAAAPERDTATVAADWSNTQILPSPAPEPASLALLALGLGVMGVRRVK